MRAAIVTLLLVLADAAIACGSGQGSRAEFDDGLVLEYRTDPAPIRVARPFTLLFHLCRNGERIAVGNLRLDASMPAHGHGMNYRPAVSPRAAGGYRAEGMLLHMPGDWQIAFDFEHEGRRRQLLLDLDP